VEGLKEKKNGTIAGGFASIKGGFSITEFSTNTWPNACVNSGDCTHSTNIGTGCSNTGTCFM
jgi:hypothetical protein